MVKQKAQVLSPQQAADLRNIPERMDIRVDWAFKHLFSKKEHLIKNHQGSPGN